MKELRAPKRYLTKKLNNLILDDQSAEIKMLLFKTGLSIPGLFRAIKKELEINGIHIAKSTFKNMLMRSEKQNCDYEKRLKVIDIILEYLDPEKVEMVYLGNKYRRDKKIRAIMKVLESDYKDKREYTPIEILQYRMDNIPDEMKTYLDSLEVD